MKAMKLPKELQSFLVFTEKKRPVAALVSLRKEDRESLGLSTNPEFLKIIETAPLTAAFGGPLARSES